MKKCVRVLAAMLAVLTMVSLSGCTSQEEADGLRTIDVCEVTHSVFYAPQYVAMSQGFFAEEGLSVELTVGQGADKVMAAVPVSYTHLSPPSFSRVWLAWCICSGGSRRCTCMARTGNSPGIQSPMLWHCPCPWASRCRLSLWVRSPSSLPLSLIHI